MGISDKTRIKNTTPNKSTFRPKANLKKKQEEKQDNKTKELILDEISKLSDADLKEIVVDIYNQVAESGLTFQQALGIPNETLEEIYSMAYGLYKQGQYSKACGLFQFLYGSNPTMYKYLFGLGSCHYQMKRYDLAATSYFFSLALNPFDPIPAYYTADSFFKGDLFTESLELFDVTISLCKDPLNIDNPDNKILMDKCILLKNSIKNKQTSPETYKKYERLDNAIFARGEDAKNIIIETNTHK